MPRRKINPAHVGSSRDEARLIIALQVHATTEIVWRLFPEYILQRFPERARDNPEGRATVAEELLMSRKVYHLLSPIGQEMARELSREGYRVDQLQLTDQQKNQLRAALQEPHAFLKALGLKVTE